MSVNKTPFVILMTLWLCACTQTRLDPIVVRDVAVSLPQPQPLSLSPVHWTVITPSTATSAFTAQAPNADGPLFLGLTEDDYKALTVNLIDIDRYMAEQRAVIDGLNRILAARAADPAQNKAPSAAR